MKKIVLLFALFSISQIAFSNDNVKIIEDLVINNNKVYSHISSLDDSKESEFYSRYYNIKTHEELKVLSTEFFGNNNEVFYNDMIALSNTLLEFKDVNLSLDDVKAFMIKNPADLDPPKTFCKCMPCFDKCYNYEFVLFTALKSFGENVATWSATGAAIGGIAGSYGAGVGAGPGAVVGLEIGVGFGAVMGMYEAMNKWKDKRADCWAVHCEGKDTSLLSTDGPGAPSGGPKFKKIEWGAF